jgi:CHASE3 domain sensor protein
MSEEMQQALNQLEEKTKAALQDALTKAAKYRAWLIAAACIGGLVGFGIGLLVGALAW